MAAVSPLAKEKQKLAKIAYSATPRGKWAQHKGQAKARGIPFSLTFDEWWEVWSLSGKYCDRGKSPDSYCMSRLGDTGGYEVGNVVIKKVSYNLAEQLVSGAHASVKVTRADIDQIRVQVMAGVTQKKVAAEFGVSQSEVSRLVSGDRGKYIT